MYQRIVIAGRLGGDPSMRYTASGAAVTEFSVATDSGYGDKKSTEWFSCIAWNKTAEAVAQYLTKGSSCLVEGRMQTRSWDDKNGGGKRYKTELICDRVQFLGGGGASAPGLDPAGADEDLDADRLPF